MKLAVWIGAAAAIVQASVADGAQYYYCEQTNITTNPTLTEDAGTAPGTSAEECQLVCDVTATCKSVIFDRSTSECTMSNHPVSQGVIPYFVIPESIPTTFTTSFYTPYGHCPCYFPDVYDCPIGDTCLVNGSCTSDSTNAPGSPTPPAGSSAPPTTTTPPSTTPPTPPTPPTTTTPPATAPPTTTPTTPPSTPPPTTTPPTTTSPSTPRVTQYYYCERTDVMIDPAGAFEAAGTAPGTSAEECQLVCDVTVTCKSVVFDRSTNECTMSDHSVVTGDGIPYLVIPDDQPTTFVTSFYTPYDRCPCYFPDSDVCPVGDPCRVDGQCSSEPAPVANPAPPPPDLGLPVVPLAPSTPPSPPVLPTAPPVAPAAPPVAPATLPLPSMTPPAPSPAPAPAQDEELSTERAVDPLLAGSLATTSNCMVVVVVLAVSLFVF